MWAISTTNWNFPHFSPCETGGRKARKILMCCVNCSQGSRSYFDFPLKTVWYLLSSYHDLCRKPNFLVALTWNVFPLSSQRLLSSSIDWLSTKIRLHLIFAYTRPKKLESNFPHHSSFMKNNEVLFVENVLLMNILSILGKWGSLELRNFTDFLWKKILELCYRRF